MQVDEGVRKMDEVVAVVASEDKADATKAAIHGKFIDVLITSMATAERIYYSS